MIAMTVRPPHEHGAGPSAGVTLGERLRAERRRRETKLVKVAAATRVGVHYLAALEHNDYDELPGEVFTKNYVRAYAEYLGLDAEELIQQYLRETVDRRAKAAGEADEKIVREMSRLLKVAPDRSRLPLWLGTGTVLALLAVAIGWWLLGLPERTVGAIPFEGEPDSVSTSAAAATSEAQQADPGTLEQESLPMTDSKDAPTPPIAAALTAGPVVAEFGVGSAVRDRNLVGQADRFEEGSEIFFWNRILDAEPGTILQHVWLHEGVEVSRSSLSVGGAHWRTHSRKTLFPGSVGHWAVEVRDPGGNTLARAEFDCEGAR